MGLTIVPAPVVASVNLQETQILSSTTFTVPAGVTKLWVTAYGGGSGGNTASAGSRVGTTGAAGAAATGQLTVTPGASITATVGAGGAGAAYDCFAGTDSVFSTITATAGMGFSWYVGSVSVAGTTRKPGPSSFGIAPSNGNAVANSGAGGGYSRYTGFNGGSGRIIVRYLA